MPVRAVRKEGRAPSMTEPATASTGRTRCSVPQALASSVGVKAQPQDVRYGLALHRRRLEATRAELMDRLRGLKRDYGRRLIGTERYLSELRGYERKMRALAGEAGEVLGGM